MLIGNLNPAENKSAGFFFSRRNRFTVSIKAFPHILSYPIEVIVSDPTTALSLNSSICSSDIQPELDPEAILRNIGIVQIGKPLDKVHPQYPENVRNTKASFHVRCVFKCIGQR